MDPVHAILEGQISEHVSSFEGTSQYTQGGTSTCGLAALNAVRIILGQERNGIKNVELLQRLTTKAMINDVVAICARWSSQLHLEVDDIMTLPMFDAMLTLTHSEYNQAEYKNFVALLRRLEEASGSSRTSSSHAPSAVVITRPPEILVVFSIPTDSIKTPNVFVIFDSHPRPDKGAKGASFILFSTLEAASRYISDLLQVDPDLLSGLGGLQWQAQLLGHYSGHMFSTRTPHDLGTDPMRSIYDANMDILEFKARLADSSARVRTLTEENSSLRKRLDQLENSLESRNHSSPVKNREKSSSNPEKLFRSRSPSPVAGPSMMHGTGRNENSASVNPTRNDIKGKTPSKREENKELETAPQMYNEREKTSWELVRHVQEEFDREDEGLKSQLRRLQKKAQVLFECPICFDEHPEDFVARLDSCKHQLCRGCMKRHMTLKLKEHRYPIICPICQLDKNAKNPGVVTRDLVEQLGFTEAQQAIWIELELSEFSIVLDCPKCRRRTFVDISDHADMELLQCPLPDCSHLWCKACQRPVEGGIRHSCDGTLELDDLVTSRGWKYCPGCKTPTEKQSGCNHMTCIAQGCNTHFCYICGQSIVKSVRRGDIQPALNAHYMICRLFEDVTG